MTTDLSRRSFLKSSATLGALGAAAATFGLSSCTSSSSSSGSDTLKLILPSDVPAGWDNVLGAINKKLKADRGFTLSTQYIAWTNYANQLLLKFTSGDHFDATDEARWLHLDQLVTNKTLTPLNSYFESNKYPNLAKTVSPVVRKYSQYGDKLYTIPQVNYASAISGFVIREDLATKYGMASIATYDDFERYLYAVKQHEKNMIPFGLDNGNIAQSVSPQPTALFNAESWNDPTHYVQQAGPNAGLVFLSPTARATGSSSPAPFWEAPGVMDALHRVRKYYQDGILNHDILNADPVTVRSLFGRGKYAATIGNTDGLTTVTFGGVSKAAKGATIAQIVPFTAGMNARPTATYQAPNNVVIPHNSPHAELVMQLQDWVSIPENHDLVAYGVEGKDWKSVADTQYQSLSRYVFPEYALCWRVSLERTLTTMAESEQSWFKWVKDYNHFVPDQFAGFYFDQTPVKTQIAQIISAFGQYGPPLFGGIVDVDSGLSSLKKAFDKAGFDKVMAEMGRQADAFLKSNP
jgi:putative aldouronate transport system substrate-binding protein